MMDSVAIGIVRDPQTGGYLFAPSIVALVASKLGLKGDVLAQALVQAALTADSVPHLPAKEEA